VAEAQSQGCPGWLEGRVYPREDAWDALQETWLIVVRELPRPRDDAAFPCWAYTMARRVAFRARQRSRVTMSSTEGAAADRQACAIGHHADEGPILEDVIRVTEHLAGTAVSRQGQ
jgi:DNA-directed RNA polymerase specialized sigma24 family protein